MALEPGLEVALGVGLDGGVGYRGIKIVEEVAHGDVAALDGFEAEQGVVDAAELAAGDEDEGIALRLEVVDGEIILGEGDHQSASAFDEDDIVTTGELVGGGGDAKIINSSEL